MRSTVINVSPQQWLTSLGNSPGQIAEIIASFGKNVRPRVCQYGADHLFLRFHGKKAKYPIFRPNYWVDGSVLRTAISRAGQYEGWMQDGEIARIAKQHYRELAAICHNWNELHDTEVWKIELRGSEVIEGIEGEIASQTTHAATPSSPASSSRLAGGGIQMYLFPRTPFVCTPVDWRSFA